MRPHYETRADLDNSKAAVRRFKADGREDWFFRRTKTNHIGDWLGTDSNGRRWLIEVKTRTCASDTYPTYTLSKRKVEGLIDRARAMNATPLLLVWWKGDDRLGAIPARAYLSEAEFGTGGRWDRNDPLDIEVMADVPIRLFRMIGREARL